MKLWKKAVSLAMVSVLALSMSACGSSENKSTGSTDTFKIGGIGPTTGDAAIYGKAVKNGAQLAVDEINKTVESTERRLNINLKMTRVMQKSLLMLTTV